MRKNSARKWLHFTLDLLPLIAIPVFMVYSHRHTLTERTEVEVNYRYETNDVNSVDDFVLGNVYHLDNLYLTNNENYGDYNFTLNLLKVGTFDNRFSGSYDDDFDISDYDSRFGNGIYLNVITTDSYLLLSFSNDNAYSSFAYDFGISFSDIVFSVSDALDDFVDWYSYYYADYHVLPSSTDFNVIESVNADTSNENIMNVFYKDFCNAIEDYFNFDNVFNFGDIWNWFETNMFGGNAPVIAHAIYEIIVYELIMDIMFLSYAVFMFIVDFAEDTLARFTGWSSRG